MNKAQRAPSWQRLIEEMEDLQVRLKDIDTKLNYLIKNLRRSNGSPHDPYNTTRSDFTD